MDGRKYRKQSTLQKLAESGRRYRGIDAFSAGSNRNPIKERELEERMNAVVAAASATRAADVEDDGLTPSLPTGLDLLFESGPIYVSRHAVKVGCVQERAEEFVPCALALKNNGRGRPISTNPKRRKVTKRMIEKARAEDPYVLNYIDDRTLHATMSGVGAYSWN